jgi:hypothetical protein
MDFAQFARPLTEEEKKEHDRLIQENEKLSKRLFPWVSDPIAYANEQYNNFSFVGEQIYRERDIDRQTQEEIKEQLITQNEQQSQVIAKLSEQIAILLEQNTHHKEENKLLKKTLESLGILPNMDTNLEKIAIQTETPPIVPDYIKSLVDDGYIKTDGKTAIMPLDDIAKYIHSTVGIDTINYKMLMQFCQHDGQPFAENSAKEAAKRCKLNK